jgi:hypothetical protein
VLLQGSLARTSLASQWKAFKWCCKRSISCALSTPAPNQTSSISKILLLQIHSFYQMQLFLKMILRKVFSKFIYSKSILLCSTLNFFSRSRNQYFYIECLLCVKLHMWDCCRKLTYLVLYCSSLSKNRIWGVKKKSRILWQLSAV